MNERTASLRNRKQSPHRKDEDEKKRYPNAISAMIVAIAKSYLNQVQPEEFPNRDMSYPEFVANSNIGDVFVETAVRYPGIANAPVPESNFDELLERMGRGEGSDMPYYRIRALADFIGIPVGLFLLFSQLISIERRVDDPKDQQAALLQLIRGMGQVVKAAERTIMEDRPHSNSGNYRFSHYHNEDKDGREIWVADIARLIEWREIFNDGELDLVHIASKKR